MNAEAVPLWLALVIQLGLGVADFRANPKSYTNQCFFIVCGSIAAWLASLRLAYAAATPSEAAFWIRNASATSVLMLDAFDLLRNAILYRNRGWQRILRGAAVPLIFSVVAIAGCYLPGFLKDVGLQPAGNSTELIPQPVYGAPFVVFAAFIAISLFRSIYCYARDARRARGVQQVELQFALAGGVALILFTIALFLLQPFLTRAAALRLAPFRVVVFSMIIAYGIATRKIMDVGTFVRRFVSYAVLAVYLAAMYFGVWWISDYFLHGSADSGVLSHLIATVAVALSMAPARGVSKNFADKLFVNASGLDFRATVSKAAAILSSVTTLSDLLERFAATISEAVGTDRVTILLRDRQGFSENYARQRSGDAVPLQLAANDPLIHHLESTHGPAVRDELYRRQQTSEVTTALQRMRDLQIAAAIGIFMRDHLSAVMLLGSRLSGRVYGSVEQNALQVLCGQLAVAIENAELFTEVQTAKIYNETLLENLTTGVIAVSADERITVFNNEAGQITGCDPREMIDRPIEKLAADVCDMLRETLRTRQQQENGELVIRSADHNVIARASSSLFHGQEGQMLGALVVLTDITALKRLELQIRRSDRLASLGTLSAGMAHEIKNPLVSIKTFAQLLPERYQDSDFRETFSNLIGHEIDRIDSLVNQLLRFARPAKPLLKPMHVHEVLEKSLQLVGHRLYQREIKLTRFWEADVDTIRADADQLEQVFLNFFLNAMDAMKNGGELSVTTSIERGDEWMAAIAGSNGHGEIKEVLRITIRDNGEGIRTEDIPHVFDPFFTTKDYGTGLGLSVVHGIVQEHGGHIEVESELEKGTAFHILLPLVRFEKKVAAA